MEDIITKHTIEVDISTLTSLKETLSSVTELNLLALSPSVQTELLQVALKHETIVPAPIAATEVMDVPVAATEAMDAPVAATEAMDALVAATEVIDAPVAATEVIDAPVAAPAVEQVPAAAPVTNEGKTVPSRTSWLCYCQ
jgi:hypothetical protein